MSKLHKMLINAYQNQDMELLINIARLDLTKFDEETLEDLKTMTLQEIFHEITFFNISILNDDYKKLPIYFLDDKWVILEFDTLDKEDILNSSGIVIESNISNIKLCLTIKEIIDSTADGSLVKDSVCISQKV